MIHSEFFSSRREAVYAGQRLRRRHGFAFNVRYAMRANMSHDWLLEVFE